MDSNAPSYIGDFSVFSLSISDCLHVKWSSKSWHFSC